MSGPAAAVDAVDHAITSGGEHCSGMSSGDEGDRAIPDLPCCTAMCSALPAHPSSVADTMIYDDPLRFGLRERASSAFLAKLPTPPPRLG